jgi:integrase
MTSRSRNEDRTVLPSGEAILSAQEVSPYDDALLRAGQAANYYVRASIFDDYHRKKSPGTLEAQKYDLALFSRFLAEMDIDRDPEDLYADAHAWEGMSASLLISFQKWLLYGQPQDGEGKLKGYSIGSVKRRVSTVRQYCRLAYQSQVLPHSEWVLIATVKADSHAEGANIDAARERQGIQPRITNRKVHATPLEAQDFLQLRRTTTNIKRYREHDVVLSERDALLICLLGEHGLRVGEVVALNAISINLRSGTITIKRHKIHQEDTLKLLPATRRASEQYLPLLSEAVVRSNGPLFEGYQGKRITRQGIYERVKDLGQLIGIPKLSPHDLRHYFAKRSFERGNPLSAIQAYGGWRSGHMPLRYAQQYGATLGGLDMGTEKE